MTEHTLQTQNLSVGYDETTIIEDLNQYFPFGTMSGAPESGSFITMQLS